MNMIIKIKRAGGLLSLILIFSFSNINAQVASWEWAKGIGGNSNEYATATYMDNKGNLYMTGYFTGSSLQFDTINLTNNCWRSLFLVKFDKDGNVLWAKSAGGTSTDRYIGTAICSDSIGNIYLTGSFKGNLNFGASAISANVDDIFVAKFDSSGNNIWTIKSNASNAAAESTGIGIDENNNLYVCGGFYQNSITFGSTTLYNSSSGSGEIFIAKFDNNGNPIWAKSAGGNYIDNVEEIAVDPEGNTYITGHFFSPNITFDTTTLINSTLDSNSTDFFIAKYNSSGTFQWAKSAGNNSNDLGNSIKADANSNIYVTGTFRGDSLQYGNNTITSLGGNSSSSFLLKLNSQGGVKWSKYIRASKGKAIDFDVKGNVIIAGDCSYPLVVDSLTINYSLGNTYVAKYDSTGLVKMVKTDDSRGITILKSLSTDDSGNIYIAGYYQGDSLRFDTIGFKNASTNGGIHDIFVAKLQTNFITSIRESIKELPHMNLYPNPIIAKLNIDLGKGIRKIKIELIDLGGKVVFSERYIYNESLSIDVSDVAKGVYIARISDEKTISTFKVVKN